MPNTNKKREQLTTHKYLSTTGGIQKLMNERKLLQVSLADIQIFTFQSELQSDMIFLGEKNV